ncbi:MAG: hypothetical protein CMK09_16570 [Ponticaulis sp.]|nr:hypothetical protein [Ponticaulis sp.]|tara:strand:- start:1689 stop:3617 length:1929 start_codon:yes stop_codon:yes gene_type:complete
MSAEQVSSVSDARVFLSYCREDRYFARQLELVLKDKGYDPLIDTQAIVPGEPWEDRLAGMIAQCDTVVFILTAKYLDSHYCNWELTQALTQGKRMVPVLPQALPPGTQVPEDLARLQYIQFYSDSEIPDSGFYVGMGKLDEALRLDLDWLRQKRRYDERAVDWGNSQSSELLLSGVLLEEAETWSNSVPKGNEIPPEIQSFIAASREREDIRIRNAKRARSVAWSAVFITAALLGATGYFYWQQQQTLGELEDKSAELITATNDNLALARAANFWADSKRQLALSEFERLTPEEIFDEQPLDQAQTGIQFLQDEINSLSPAAKTAHRDTIRSMRRDLAKIFFFKENSDAIATINDLIAEQQDDMAALNAEDLVLTGEALEMARTGLRVQLGRDVLSRAVYACLDNASVSDIRAGLDEVSIEVLEDPQVPSVLRFLDKAPDRFCENARAVICEQYTLSACELGMTDAVRQQSIYVQQQMPAPLAPATGGDNTAQPPPPRAQVQMPIRQTPALKDRSYSSQDRLAYQISDLVIHVSTQEKMKAAELFAAKLRERGYTVSLELVKGDATRSIRYYYDIQEEQVKTDLTEACIAAAEAALSDLDRSGDANAQTEQILKNWSKGYERFISLEGRFKGLRKNRVEIWF